MKQLKDARALLTKYRRELKVHAEVTLLVTFSVRVANFHQENAMLRAANESLFEEMNECEDANEAYHSLGQGYSEESCSDMSLSSSVGCLVSKICFHLISFKDCGRHGQQDSGRIRTSKN